MKTFKHLGRSLEILPKSKQFLAANQYLIGFKSLLAAAMTCLWLLGANAFCQTLPTPDTAIGTSPLASYDVSAIDNVNPINGNIYLNLPLVSFPQVGKDLKLDFKIYYNAKGWSINYQPPPVNDPSELRGSWWMQDAGGVYVANEQHVSFGDSTSTVSNSESTSDAGGGGVTATTTYQAFCVSTPDGASHYYADTAQSSCSATGYGLTCPETYSIGYNTYPATDGSGFIMKPGTTLGTAALSVIDPSGVTYAQNFASSYSETVTDVDGNSIAETATGWTDSIGRSIPGSTTGVGLPITEPTYPTSTGSSYPDAVYPGVSTPPGSTPCPADSTGARIWTLPSVGDTTATYYFCFSTITYSSAFGLDTVFNTNLYQNISESGPFTMPALTAIVLPNGTEYLFAYDQYLDLTQISLPFGASINYTWQTVPFMYPQPITQSQYQYKAAPVSRAISTRTVYPGNGEAAETWTYHWYLNTQNAGVVSYMQPSWSVVTDPNGNDVEHQLGGPDASGANSKTLVETQTAYYLGCGPHDTATNRTCGAGSTLLETKAYVLTQVASNGAGFGSTSYYSTVVPTLKPTTITTLLPTSSGSLESKIVVTKSPLYGSCSVSSLSAASAQSAVPPTYERINPCYLYDQVQSTSTYDWGINSVGSLLKTDTTTYLWNAGQTNSSAYLAANLFNLVSSTATTGSSGSLAAETEYYYDQGNGSPQGTFGNVTSMTKVNQTGSSTTTQGIYSSNGEVRQVIDGKNYSTSITYQCAGSLPYQITNPLGQVNRYTFDCNTGLLTKHQDPNSVVQGTEGWEYSYDSMRNPISITRPDNGNTTISYNGYALPLTVTKKTTATPSPSEATSIIYDGFIKPVQIIQANGATSETTYDLLGRVQSVTNPHFGISASTDGITSTHYDALSRTVETINPDSTMRWICYNGLSTSGQPNCHSLSGGQLPGAWIDSSDENGNNWQHTTDALGRLTQVMEPSGSAQALTVETDYNYDALSDVTSVTQWGGASGSSGARTRSFTYDNLMRLVSATNPETGTTAYSYDANSNLSTKIDARSVTTSYSYDSINRLVGKSYSNDAAATPWSCYLYDTPLTGTSQANSLGHLTAEWTQTGACPTSGGPTGAYLMMRSILGYDPMGRITSEQQQQCFNGVCAPAQQYQMNYGYDLAGDMTNSDNGLGTIAFQLAYDSAARLSTVNGVSAFQGQTFPSALFNATTYGPIGITNWTMGPNVVSAGQESPALTFIRSYDTRMRVVNETVAGQQ